LEEEEKEKKVNGPGRWKLRQGKIAGFFFFFFCIVSSFNNIKTMTLLVHAGLF